MHPLRQYWRNLALGVLALFLVFMSFKTGLDGGMGSDRIEPSMRYRFYGVPIVLSQIYYGRPYDYTAYNSIARQFQQSEPTIDVLIDKVKAVPPVESQGLFFILADDKGSVDLVRLAFFFYGVASASFYYMYFTILLASCLLYLVTYFTDIRKLAPLVFLCLAFYATVPAYLAFPPGTDLLDVHGFGMLSLVACLHLLVAVTEPKPTRPLALVTAAAQAVIFLFVYHTRSSTFTQALAIVMGGSLLAYLSWRRDRSSASIRRRLVPVAIVIAVMSSLPLYQHSMYHPEYFGRRATLQHGVYHSLLLGLTRNPALRERYDLGEADLGIVHAVDRYVENRGTHAGPRGWAADGTNSVTTQAPFDWGEYEEDTRDLYFKIWTEQPKECLLTMLYWHPLDAYGVLNVYLGNSPGSLLSQVFPDTTAFRRQYAFNPLRVPNLLVLVAAVILATARGRTIMPDAPLVAAIMFASALVIPIVVYGTGLVVLAESFVTGGLLLYATLGALLSWLLVRALDGLATR